MSKKNRICNCCGKKFNLEDTKECYNEYFDYELDYDDHYEGNMCFECAMDETVAALGEADEINEFRY